MTVPAAWQERLASYDWAEQTIGMSRASVFRLAAPGEPTLFIKTEPAAHAELPGEIARLRWLEGKGVAAPRVIDAIAEVDRHYLLMSAVLGVDFASQPETDPKSLVRAAALALRELHTLPIADCPFDRRITPMLAMAEDNIAAGLVDTDDFDTEHLGRDPAELLAEAAAGRPAETDLVVCHGDASMPNFMGENGQFTGFVDCGRLGIADRYQDLALAAWSIAFNYGDAAVPLFFNAYGVTPDEPKLAFYRLLDEFF
jgi:aminoglycoside 3'-phosphotransferase-2